MKDIIVVVPRGARVRYVETGLTDGRVYALDAENMTAPVSWQFPWSRDLFGLPVHDAERYTDAADEEH